YAPGHSRAGLETGKMHRRQLQGLSMTSASVRSITAVRPPSGISTMPLPEPVKGRRPTDGGHT
uniref:hypothetical protein n=1 Tax=Phocaeicola vulgatus TaxID=821 RepID=UPI00216AFF8D